MREEGKRAASLPSDEALHHSRLVNEAFPVPTACFLFRHFVIRCEYGAAMCIVSLLGHRCWVSCVFRVQKGAAQLPMAIEGVKSGTSCGPDFTGAKTGLLTFGSLLHLLLCRARLAFAFTQPFQIRQEHISRDLQSFGRRSTTYRYVNAKQPIYIRHEWTWCGK